MGTTREHTRSVKIATGIQARYSKHSTSIRILFYYKGKECRETLGIEPTPSHIKYAIRLRGEILNAIARNSFSYAYYFPHSKRARLFGHVATNVTIKELLNQFLEETKKTQQPSTYTSYLSACQAHLIPTFGEIPLQELAPRTIRQWLKSLRLTSKSVRNILIPLRTILEEALNDDMIERNPLDRVVLAKLLKKKPKSDYEVNPFDSKEINAILAHAEGQARNLFQFAFFTGLRTSELIALEWEDIDWVHGIAHISRAVVEKQEKCTKTPAGEREVLLLPPALEALQHQKAYTFLASKRVFHNSYTGKPWETDNQIRETCWVYVLKRAGVRYRNPYQTRHTYASMMLSAGENILWVAKQMGHIDTKMLIKTYAKWIPSTDTVTGYQPVQDWGKVVNIGLSCLGNNG